MLGVLGCVPALDDRFCENFQCTYDAAQPTDRKTFAEIGTYYESRRESIDAKEFLTLAFSTGLETTRRYPRAKIIDMIFWEAGSS